MALMMLAFPGQGSQVPGMAQAFADEFQAAREVLQEVDDALDQHLSRLMHDGPMEELTLTENAQPALMAASLAAVRVIESETSSPLSQFAQCAAGHSLGEYSAYAALGTFSIGDTARLLRQRGQAMQQAVPPGEGAMAALIGLSPDQVDAVVAEVMDGSDSGEVLAFANDNGGGQAVVSGTAKAVERAMALAKEQGAKRALPLSVSAPFHCALMQPAAHIMEEALAQTAIANPSLPVYSNVTASPVKKTEDIPPLLVEQVTGRVRWRESVLAMTDHLKQQAEEADEEASPLLAELGTGKVLSGLARRIAPELTGFSVSDPEGLKVFLNHIG